MIKLVQEFGAHTGRQLSFDQARVRIGRAPTNDVAFDPNVDLDSSGNHCEVVREDGVYFVVDQNSRNGTFVNGMRVQKQRLGSGDVIECGRGGPRLKVELPTAQPVALAPPVAAMPAYVPASTEAMPAFGGPPSFRANTPAPVGAMGYAPASVPPAPMPTPYGPSHLGVPAFGPSGVAPAPAIGPASPSGNFGAPNAPALTGPSVGFAPALGTSPPGPISAGSAVAARLPAGAQVGKRTVAMMIDAALAQAAGKKSSTGLKVAVVFTIVLVIAAIGVGGYFLWSEKQNTEERLAEVSGGGTGDAGERIARQYEGAIYMLAASDPGGAPEGFCTGFAVTQDLIATNAHCIDLAQEIATQRGRSIVALRNNGRGQQIPAQPLWRDPRFRNPSMGTEGSGYDVGIVRTAQPLPTQVRLITPDAASRLTPGASIYVYGFPGMTMNGVSPVATITSGVLSRMTDFFDRAADDPMQALKIQHSAQTTSGSSGSPIFIASGEVIGVNAGSLADDEHQSIVDPTTGRRVSVEVNRSSNFKYGMRADLIRAAIQAVGENAQ